MTISTDINIYHMLLQTGYLEDLKSMIANSEFHLALSKFIEL